MSLERFDFAFLSAVAFMLGDSEMADVNGT
jgi:hypothetical protein